MVELDQAALNELKSILWQFSTDGDLFCQKIAEIESEIKPQNLLSRKNLLLDDLKDIQIFANLLSQVEKQQLERIEDLDILALITDLNQSFNDMLHINFDLTLDTIRIFNKEVAPIKILLSKLLLALKFEVKGNIFAFLC